MISDTSVARNFAVLGWTDQLVALSTGVIRVAPDVIGPSGEEPGEVEEAKAYFDGLAQQAHLGSREQTDAVAAGEGLADLVSRRSTTVEVVQPTGKELSLALRLRDPAEREWRANLGMRARRLDAGESVSIAIALTRDVPLASDDGPGVRAFRALGGEEHYWTRDLLKRAVDEGLLTESEARDGYQKLRQRYSFRAPDW